MQERSPIIAIDGPAGAGKSTVARALATRLGFFLLDTGAIYRTLALRAGELGIEMSDGPGLAALAQSLPLRFGRGEEEGRVYLIDGGDLSLGRDITQAIRSPEVSLLASQVSAHPEVRAALLPLQRRLAESGPCVVEGRDVGTVVLPHATIKIFLTASPEVRARRRYEELRARGVTADLGMTLREQHERDQRDLTREAAPLRQAEDAVPVDTSDLPLPQVIDRLEALCRERLAADGVSQASLITTI